jgi:hypothetical protein
MKDLIIYDKSSRDIMEYYFSVLLNTTVAVLEDIDDDELKFEVEKCRKELQVDFIETEYNIRY